MIIGMKYILFISFSLTVFALSISAQVSPRPVADTEVRDSGSIRMRSLEFERVKRDANKPRAQETSKEAEIRFATVSEDFEKIQKLQSAIVTAYTRGSAINYKKIRDAATEMERKAARLEVNFFDSVTQTGAIARDSVGSNARYSVRALIIELDGVIGRFVASPIFRNGAKVDAKVLEGSQEDLEKIIGLSNKLAQAAEIAN